MNGSQKTNKLNQFDWVLLKIILSKNNCCSSNEIKTELKKLIQLNELVNKPTRQYINQRLNLLVLFEIITVTKDIQNFYSINENLKSPIFHIVTGMNDLNYALKSKA